MLFPCLTVLTAWVALGAPHVDTPTSSAHERFLQRAVHIQRERPAARASVLPGTTGRRFVLTATQREVTDWELARGVDDPALHARAERAAVGALAGLLVDGAVLLGAPTLFSSAFLAALGGVALYAVVALGGAPPVLLLGALGASAVAVAVGVAALAVVPVWLALRSRIYAPLSDSELESVVAAYNRRVAVESGLDPSAMGPTLLDPPVALPADRASDARH